MKERVGVGLAIGRSRPLRPQISVELLSVATSAYCAIAFNEAFWTAIQKTGVTTNPNGDWVVGSLYIAMIALHAMFLALILNKWTAKPVVSVLLIMTAGASYFSQRYAVHFDPEMVRNVLRTDALEASELMTPELLWSVLINGLIPAVMIWFLRIRSFGLGRALVRRALFLAGTAGVSAAALLISFQDVSSLMRNNKGLRYLVTPGNFIVSSASVLFEEAGNQRGPRRVIASDARMTKHAPGTKPHFLVIVVGETVRAQNWGMSGYVRQTTPQLAVMDVVNFTDVTACGSNTEVSVPCMFSLHGRRNYDRDAIRDSESLLHVLERSGVKTLWRDNQTGCKGVCDGLAFESYREPRENVLCDDQTCRDEIKLQGLHEAIEESPGDVVVVLHQLGNHGPSYYKRYPPSLRVFRPDCTSADLGDCTQAEIVNAYDNAVLATDDFLARTIRMLADDKSHDTAMLYVSDHGESLGEGNLYLHGLPYAIAPQTQTRVPMVVWLAAGMRDYLGIDAHCLKDRATGPTSHDNLFHSVLGLMQVESSSYDARLDVFQSCMPKARKEQTTPTREVDPSARLIPANDQDSAGSIRSNTRSAIGMAARDMSRAVGSPLDEDAYAEPETRQ